MEVSFVNIHKYSGGKYKDFTDLIRDGFPKEQLGDIFNYAKIIPGEKEGKAQNIAICEPAQSTATPEYSDKLYTNLPDTLRELTGLFSQKHKKDVFLTATLPVLAAHMPNVKGAHADGYYSPDVFTLIVADPGTGKGTANKAKALGKVLNEILIKESEHAMTKYEFLSEEEKAYHEIPKPKSLLIPANSSSRAIYDALESNDERGLIFESEIDTMLNAMGQEWGDFSDIVRKSFHHEDASISRKGERFVVKHPCLSMCLTGTFDQFKKMFISAENGFYSRFGMYTYNVKKEWQSHRPTRQSRQLEDRIYATSERLADMYRTLKGRDEFLYIDLKQSHWDEIDAVFSDKMQKIEDEGLSKYLHASNKRAAIIALRIIMQMAILRSFDEDFHCLKLEHNIIPVQEDIDVGLQIAKTFIQHAIRLYHILPKASVVDAKGERYTQFIADLPNEFRTADAYAIGEILDVPKRTVRSWLNENPHLKRIKKGHYVKG